MYLVFSFSVLFLEGPQMQRSLTAAKINATKAKTSIKKSVERVKVAAKNVEEVVKETPLKKSSPGKKKK